MATLPSITRCQPRQWENPLLRLPPSSVETNLYVQRAMLAKDYSAEATAVDYLVPIPAPHAPVDIEPRHFLHPRLLPADGPAMVGGIQRMPLSALTQERAIAHGPRRDGPHHLNLLWWGRSRQAGGRPSRIVPPSSLPPPMRPAWLLLLRPASVACLPHLVMLTHQPVAGPAHQ